MDASDYIKESSAYLNFFIKQSCDSSKLKIPADKERYNKHRYDAKNRPDNNELAFQIHKYQHDFEKDIEVLILKGNLHQKRERELWEDKFICFLGTEAPMGLNVESKDYKREIYGTFTDFAAYNTEILHNLPVRKVH